MSRYTDAFKQALAEAGVRANTPSTVLSGGDADLWRPRREALPDATVVLDCWGGTSPCASSTLCRRRTALARPARTWPPSAVRGLERAKWCLSHGRRQGCRRTLAALCRWTQYTNICGVAGIVRLKHHANELLGYLERNEGALVHYAARRRDGEAISIAFVESPVNGIVAKRMNRKQDITLNRDNGAGPSRRADSGFERYARGHLPRSIFRVQPRERRRGNLIGGVMNPTGLDALSGRLRHSCS